eukprot:7166169-Prymnesium_polylepis.1
MPSALACARSQGVRGVVWVWCVPNAQSTQNKARRGTLTRPVCGAFVQLRDERRAPQRHRLVLGHRAALPQRTWRSRRQSVRAQRMRA